MVANHSTGGDVPTPEEFEEAQEAHDDDGPYDGPHFLHAYKADEFDDYTELTAFIAAQEANRGASAANSVKWNLDSVKSGAKTFFMVFGATYLLAELVEGNARL